MNKVRVQGVAFAGLMVAVLGVAVGAQNQRPSGQAGVPTFSKDVAPIFYNNCINCHRPGENAPMSLTTYEEARPYLTSIKAKVESGVMPPWHAEAPAGTFLNDRRITPAQRDFGYAPRPFRPTARMFDAD